MTQIPQTDQKKSSRSCLLTLGSMIGIPLSGILVLVILEILLWGIGGILVIADPLVESAAGAILSGGDATRLEEAATLYWDGYIDYLILTETGITDPELNTNYSSIVRMEAIEMGVPSTAILITSIEVENTADEARAVLEISRKNGFSSLIIITDPFHTLRTRLIFNKYFKDSGISINVRPARDHWYQSDTWWLTSRGRKATINEYLRLLLLPFN